MNPAKLALQFTYEKLVSHLPLEDQEDVGVLDMIRKSIPEAQVIIKGLKPATELTPDHYRVLELLDVLTNGYIARLLSENGYACSTGCPGCHVDDFVHVESCKVSYTEQLSSQEEGSMNKQLRGVRGVPAGKGDVAKITKAITGTATVFSDQSFTETLVRHHANLPWTHVPGFVEDVIVDCNGDTVCTFDSHGQRDLVLVAMILAGVRAIS